MPRAARLAWVWINLNSRKHPLLKLRGLMYVYLLKLTKIPEFMQLRKDTITALVKSASVFVSYLSTLQDA